MSDELSKTSEGYEFKVDSVGYFSYVNLYKMSQGIKVRLLLDEGDLLKMLKELYCHE